MSDTRPKHGMHYEMLADFGRANDYPLVTRSVVQSWVRHGLLPRVLYHRPAFGVREVIRPPRIEDQLLALCRLRYDAGIRSHRLLASALWTEGWDISLEVARDGLRATVEPLANLANEQTRERFAWQLAQPRNRPQVWSKAAQTAALADALFEFLARISGAARGSSSGLAELAYLEEVSGLSRARTDSVGAAGPWLEVDPGAGLGEGAEETSGPRLLEGIDRASADELLFARSTAAQLTERLGILLPAMQLGYGSDFAGLAMLAPPALDDPLSHVMLVLIALVEPDATGAFLDDLPSGSELAEIEQALSVARDLLAADPILSEQADRLGLVEALARRNAADDAKEPSCGQETR